MSTEDYKTSLTRLSEKYGVPEDRLDVLILLCLMNRQFTDFNSLTEPLGLPAFCARQGDGEFLHDFFSVFTFGPVNLQESEKSWESLAGDVKDLATVIKEYIGALSEGQTVLPEHEWYGCDRFGITRLTPCALRSCPSWIDTKRCHCDGRYTCSDRTFDSIATKQGESLGSVEYSFERAIKYLGSLESGIPQRLSGVKPSLQFGAGHSDACSFCGEIHAGGEGLCELIEGHKGCADCIAARSWPGAIVEIRYRIPIDVAFRIVTFLHQTFEGQAASLDLSKDQLRILYEHFGREAELLPTDETIFGRRAGRKPPVGVLIAVSAYLWAAMAESRVSRSVVTRISKLHRNLLEIVPGLTPLKVVTEPGGLGHLG